MLHHLPAALRDQPDGPVVLIAQRDRALDRASRSTGRLLEWQQRFARQALRFALDAGARKVSINAHPPVATLTADQLRELLALVEKEPGQAGGAEAGPGPAGDGAGRS